MQHIYCTECGSKVSYSGAKPKFCSSCGTLLVERQLASLLLGREKKPATKTEQSSASTPLQDDETDIDYVPNIGKLSYDLAHEGSGNKTYKFGDIVNVEQEKKARKVIQKKIKQITQSIKHTKIIQI